MDSARLPDLGAPPHPSSNEGGSVPNEGPISYGSGGSSFSAGHQPGSPWPGVVRSAPYGEPDGSDAAYDAIASLGSAVAGASGAGASVAGASMAGGVRRRAPIPVKIIIAGGFGVGKTTTVAAISEIEPLTTEAEMTAVAAGIDDPGPTGKTTTTVAMDFGCVTIDETLKLYLFGAPGQVRFGFMWDDLARGALGALVVVDASRLDDGFAAVDYFERAKLPFAVGVNAFYGQLAHDLDTVRWALALSDEVPVVAFDARDRLSVRDAVLVVLNRALDRAMRSQAPDM